VNKVNPNIRCVGVRKLTPTYANWLLRAEDFVVYVICKDEPDISRSSEPPNSQLDRGTTYFA
jgi:hypothetical protein